MCIELTKTKKIIKKIHENTKWAINCKEFHNIVFYKDSPMYEDIKSVFSKPTRTEGYSTCTLGIYYVFIMAMNRLFDNRNDENIASFKQLFTMLEKPEIKDYINKYGINEEYISEAKSQYKSINGNHKLARLRDNARNALLAHSALDIESRKNTLLGDAEFILKETLSLLIYLNKLYVCFGLTGNEYNYKFAQERARVEAEAFWRQFVK
ncbi:hypothetical protein ACFL6H_01315 [Candidatus Latescibacterota bacterium]